MDIWQLILLGLAGALAGWVNVLAGGGSLLTIPIMLLLGMPGPLANGTNRVGILLQNGAATATFFRRGYADWRLGLSLALAAVPGAVLGAMLGTRLSGELFERLLAMVMLVVLVLMWKSPQTNPAVPQRDQLTRSRLLVGHLAMLGVGFWGGIIQVGVGFILMPVLYRILGLDLVRVNQHKVFIVLIYGAIALLIFLGENQVLWTAGLCLAAGNLLGGWLGARTTLAGGEMVVRRVFIAVLLACIAKLVI